MIDISSRFGIADSIISDIRALPPQRLMTFVSLHVSMFESWEETRKILMSFSWRACFWSFRSFSETMRKIDGPESLKSDHSIRRLRILYRFARHVFWVRRVFSEFSCEWLQSTRNQSRPVSRTLSSTSGSSNQSPRTSTPEMQIVLVNVTIVTWIFDFHQIICHLSFSCTII